MPNQEAPLQIGKLVGEVCEKKKWQQQFHLVFSARKLPILPPITFFILSAPFVSLIKTIFLCVSSSLIPAIE